MKAFYRNARRLDKLKESKEPGPAELKELLGIIEADEALESYFYAENELSPRPTSGWVRLLAEAGEFQVLGRAEASNKVVSRLKARYLEESATEVPEEVLKVTGSITPRDEWAQGAFLDAVKNMSDDHIEKGDWIFWEFFRSSQKEVWFYAGRHATELMIKMVGINPDKAFGMARVLLGLKALAEKDSYSQKATSDFENYVYEEVIQAYLKNMCTKYPVRATKVLLNLLTDYMESANKKDATEAQDFLYFTVRDLAANDPLERDFLAALIEGICQAGKIAIGEEPENLSKLFRAIRDRSEGIFKRIEMYLLRFVSDGAHARRINELIATRENFDNTYMELEYTRLLKDKFRCLTEKTINMYKGWIREMHVEDKEKYSKWFVEVNGRACTDADIEKYENRMRARKLYDVQEVFAELYHEVREGSGWSEEEIRPWRNGEIRSIDPSENTPRTRDEILEMSVDDVLAFVSDPKNYEGTRQEWKPGSPREGLAYEFQMAIKERPLDYLNASIEAVIGLDEGFLSKYFHGIWDAIRDRKVEGFDWERYLEIARAVIDKYAPSGVMPRAFHPLVDSLRECFRDDNKVEHRFERLQAIYDIVRSLLDFEEAIDTSYEKDPVQLRCNSVTGEALECCVSLGIVCRRDFEEQWVGAFRDKIRNAFEKALSEIKTPWTCCTFGTDFSRIYWLDREWVEARIGIILSDEMWGIVWNTYLRWGRPSRDLFVFLARQGTYFKAINKLGSADEDYSEQKLDEKLSDHLVIAYFNGWLDNGLEQVYEGFLASASDSLLGHTSRFFTTGFKSLREESDDEKKMTVARLRGYWQKRLDSVTSAPEKHTEEAKGLASWIIDSPFESRDSLLLVYRTLIVTEGQLSRRGDVGHSINAVCKVAGADKLTALKCIRMILRNQDVEIYDHFFADELKRLLEGVIEEQLPDIHVIQEAADLVDDLGRLRMYKYAAFYDRLYEKLQALTTKHSDNKP